MSLEEALAGRRSIRELRADPLDDTAIGQLLWAAQGVTDEAGHRTAPSAGALYPLELYVATATGVSWYRPLTHALELVSRADRRPDLGLAALGQEVVATAPLVIVVTGVVERTAARYGGRAERYVALEAGHAAQDILLEATALGLGAVPVGAFDDATVRRVLELPADRLPLYLIPVGRPR
jgi:SagB-type dehydrogenase family enzyme